MIQPLHVATAVIENARGEILIAQRPPTKQLAGLWEFPGGKLESGESAEQALHRELQEELELEVKVLEFLGEFPYSYDWGEVLLHAFRVSALNAAKATVDVEVFRWINPSDLDVLQLVAADVAVFYFYREHRT